LDLEENPLESRQKSIDIEEEQVAMEKDQPQEESVEDLRRNLQDLTINEQQIVKDLPREWRTSRGLSLDNVIGNVDKKVTTRSKRNNFCMNVAFVS